MRMFALRALSATAACSALVAIATAQAPNDECANAIPVTYGSNGPFTNSGATTSAPAWPGNNLWVNDVWFTYVADCTASVTAKTCGADFDTAIQVFDGTCGSLNPVTFNTNQCGRQNNAVWAATRGTTYYIRVAGFYFSRLGSFPLDITCNLGFDIIGVAENPAGSGALGLTGGTILAGDSLRWNYTDRLGLFAGKFAATVANIGNGGTARTGTTPAIPGFQQLWSGSNPAGVEVILGPVAVGGGDFSVQIPSGLFSGGDTVRIQGLVIDPALSLGTVPVVATSNTLEWQFTTGGNACVHSEGFEGIPTQYGSVPAGWRDFGPRAWRPVSSGGSPEGSQYIYCDTSLPSPKTYRLTSPVYARAGLTTLEFYLGRLNSTLGTLDVLIGDGVTTAPNTLIARYSSPAAGGARWTLENVLLTGTSPNVQFMFLYSTQNSQTDIAIDGFCLK